MYRLEVYEVHSQAEHDALMEYLNKQTAVIFENAHQEYLSICQNDAQRQIFTDWWNGKCVVTPEYKSKFSYEDDYEAHSIILTACSDGFG